jgi:hypothetical protein
MTPARTRTPAPRTPATGSPARLEVSITPGRGPGTLAGRLAAGPARSGRLIARLDPRRAPGWVQALLVLAASRVLVWYVGYRAASLAAPHADGTPWGYLEIANNWDGTWYQRVAAQGYPDLLPYDATGAVAPSTWAFYPLFPWLVRFVTQATGLSWTPAATVVALACSAGTVVVIRSLLARPAGPKVAIWAVALLCFFPAAAVLQLPYAESTAILLLASVFWMLQRRRYLTAVPLLLLVGLARPIAVPLAAVLVLHLLRELWATRSLTACVRPLAACVAAVIAAVEWPLIAWSRTGVRDAYTLTMAAWRTPRRVVPFRPWWDASQLFLGHVIGPTLLLAAIAGLAWWLTRPSARLIGPDLRAWCACYGVYLLAVLDSFTSLPRYLLPMFPLGALLAASARSRAFRLAVTAAFAVLLVIWMLAVWRSRIWAP